MKFNIFILLFACATVPSLAQKNSDLKRRAFWGVSCTYSNTGLKVTKTTPGSSFHKARVFKDDIIMSVDKKNITSNEQFTNFLKNKYEGDVLSLELLRNNDTKKITVIADPYPYETEDGVSFEYGSFTTSSGDHLRTIVSRPSKINGKLTAILFVQWLSCDHVEAQPTFMDGNVRLIHELSKAGYLVMRTDKPGVGDSQGTPCNEYGFNYELQIHKEALQELRKREDIDLNSIIIMGSSMGGTMAPMIAQGQNVKGLIVTGCYYKTWYEHMLEIERRISYLEGDRPSTTYEKMKKWSKFYSLYLNDKIAPGTIIAQYPEFKDLWQDEPEHQYGRSVTYYMEAMEHNVADYWSKINVPVLVIYGEYDWIMSRQDHQMIVRAMNDKVEGLGTYIEIPKMDHGLNIYESQESAYTSFSSAYNQDLTTEVLQWLARFNR